MKWGGLNLVEMRRKWRKVEVGCLSLSQKLKLLALEQCGKAWNEEGCVVTSREFMVNELGSNTAPHRTVLFLAFCYFLPFDFSAPQIQPQQIIKNTNTQNKWVQLFISF